MFEQVPVPDIRPHYKIKGHVELEDRDGIALQGSPESFLPGPAQLMHSHCHIRFGRFSLFAALLRYTAFSLLPDAGDHLYRYTVPLFDQPVVHLHPSAVF